TQTALTLDGTTLVSFSISSTTWTHVCACRAGSTVTVYVDGTAVGTTTAPRGFETAGVTFGSGLTALVSDARVYARAKYTRAFTARWKNPTDTASSVSTAGSSVLATITAPTYRPVFVAVRFTDGSEVGTLVRAAAYQSPASVVLSAPATAIRTAPVSVTVTTQAKGYVDVYAGTTPVGSAAIAATGPTTVTCVFATAGTASLRVRFRDEENALQSTYVSPAAPVSVAVSEYTFPVSATVTWDAQRIEYGVEATGTVVLTGANLDALKATHVVVSVGANTASTTTYTASPGTGTATVRVSIVPTAAAIEKPVVRVACPLPGATSFATLTAPTQTTIIGYATRATARASIPYAVSSTPVYDTLDAAGSTVDVKGTDVKYSRCTSAPAPVLVTDSLGIFSGSAVAAQDDDDATLVCALALNSVPAVDATGRTVVVSTGTSRSTVAARYYGASTAFTTGSTVVVSTIPEACFTGDFTVEVYARPTAQDGVIFSTGTGMSLALVLPLSLWVNDTVYGWTAKVTPASSLALNTWSHVAVVRYKGTTTIYVNGSPVGSTTATRDATTTTATVGSFQGTLTDLRVYSAAKYFSSFASDADFLVQRDMPSPAITPNSYRSTVVFVGLRNPDREVRAVVRTTPFVFPTAVATSSLLVPFPNATSTAKLTLTGYDTTTEGQVELYTATTTLGTKTVLTKQGATDVQCTFTAAGTYAVSARVYRPDGKNATLGPVSFAVRAYTFPVSVAATASSTWIIGVPSTVRATFTGLEPDYAPSTAFSVGATNSGPWTSVYSAPAAASLDVQAVVPTDAAMYLRAELTGPDGTKNALVSGSLAAGQSVPAVPLLGLAADYGQTGLTSSGATVAVASPQCNQAPSFAEFAARAFVGDFSVILALTNAPCGSFHILASPTAGVDALSLGVSKAGAAPYIAQAPNNKGFGKTGALSSFSCHAGRDVVTADFQSVSLAAGRFGLATSTTTTTAALGTALYKIERAGTTLTVQASTNGTVSSWSTTAPTAVLAVAGTYDPFASITVPTTHAVVLGVSVAGTGHSATAPLDSAPLRAITAIDATQGVDLSAPSSQLEGKWVQFNVTKPSYVSSDTVYARVCVLYTASTSSPVSISVDGSVMATATLPLATRAWHTTLTFPYFWQNKLGGTSAGGLVLHFDVPNTASYPGTGTTLTDVSNGRTATLTNGPTYSSSNGGSLAFDGIDDYVLGTTIPASTFAGAHTIAGWVNRKALTDSACLFSNNVSMSEGSVLCFGTAASGTANSIGVTRVGHSSTGVWVDLGSDHLNQWLYVAAVYSGATAGSTVTVYAFKNGSALSSTGKLDWNLAAGSSYYVGSSLNGNIAQVMVYNRALAVSEVFQNYNSIKARYGGIGGGGTFTRIMAISSAASSASVLPTIHGIRVVPVAGAAPSFPSAVALASVVSVAEGTQTTVPLTVTGGSGSGSLEVYYSPVPVEVYYNTTPVGSLVLFGTAPIAASVSVSGTFCAAGTYRLYARAISAHGVPSATLVTPTSVTVTAYPLPSSVASTTLASPVLGVAVTATATISGTNVASISAANIVVSLGSAVAYAVSYASPVVTFTVVPSAVGAQQLAVRVAAPVVGSSTA
ncbi:MAG: hypothetical protein EBZ77_03965, partial [Chitinophagia bacterium]|nr:hypothetical protein [Chitinophagia bacterium]